ncbi:MAG: ATP-binding protein [Actinomycetota bacterium]|nr:ATP-binding protein [Actinomycetota bacterium]
MWLFVGDPAALRYLDVGRILRPLTAWRRERVRAVGPRVELPAGVVVAPEHPVLHITAVADPAALVAVRHRLAEWARGAGLDEEQVAAVVLAGYECLANVADHAYAGKGTGTAVLQAVRARDGAVHVVVTDHGRWRTPADDPGTRGHGLPLIRRLADTVEVTCTATGTTVHLAWTLSRVHDR